MFGKKVRRFAALGLTGLCIAAQANTTAPVAEVKSPPSMKVAVLLPLGSAALGGAANSVLAGIKAGHEREPGRVTLHVFETDGSAEQTVKAYADAVVAHDLVIGPLSRSEVAAVAQVTGVSTRTIALSPSDSETGELPGHILAVGLSIEEEARQVAQWTSIAQPSAKVYAVSTGSAWQKRAAKAYAAQAKILDLNVQAVEIPYGEGYLSGEAMEQLRKQLHASSSPLIFAALDASQTIQLRTAIGPDVPIYGTSQLNPRVLADWKTLAPINELDGVRLLDMPWQLQPDHLAVMVYPKPVPEPDRRRSADMERLYALGIDAYRVAHELAQGRSNVTIDGVTGRMSVRVDTLHPFFERLSQQAVYQNGAVAPLSNPSPTFK